ncbi:unnamed protein product [Caenorhabditis nigoni]
MSVTLAYPVMGPILEFMEANKRIHLSSRCPSLHTIDKSTPLRLDFLDFRANCIQINLMLYHLSHCEERYVENQSQIEDKSSRESLAPGDIQIDGNAFPKFRQFVEFRIGNGLGRESVRRLPAHLEIHVALKKLSTYLLGGRQTPIKVADELVFFLNRGDILRLPENLKIWVKTLKTMHTNFMDILPILDPSSFPLETLILKKASVHNLQSPVFRTARNVEILGDGVSNFDEEEWHLEFQKLPNKNIFMEYDYYGGDRIVDLIRYWMENGKEIGTCWNFVRRPWEDLVRELDLIKAEIGGTYRRAAIGYALILPFNDDSELVVHAVRIPKFHQKALQLVIQPKVERSSFTDKIIDPFYANWRLYTLSTVLTLLFGSFFLTVVMGPYAILCVTPPIFMITIFMRSLMPTR